MNILETIKHVTVKAFSSIYSGQINSDDILILNTRKEFKGDFTFNVFPWLKMTKKPPEATARELGDYLMSNINEISGFNVIKGFLNIEIAEKYWVAFIKSFDLVDEFDHYGKINETVMIEYSSPNTNKPLHLGHIRNNLIGSSLSNIIEASGKNVIEANLINDRGIHICKSMLAWQKWGNGETPDSSGIKGDHLVGKYYVKFNEELNSEIRLLKSSGLSDEEANNTSVLLAEAHEMLMKWERGEETVIRLWKEMNDWVYRGFEITYQNLGISFDKIYYESETYKEGKSIVLNGLEKGVFYKKVDDSVWVDLTGEGLDEKLLLRPDGTSVYITQDLGTVVRRFSEFDLVKLIYVVGNEQNYHFEVLKNILQKAGYSFYFKLFHLSYGMVELPEGKMKSREGTVVDADMLIDEMMGLACETSKELGKLEGLTAGEIAEINRTTAMGALKYYILKIDPKKNMTFNPKESIDFNGNTGVFIQYTHARINSLISKSKENNILIDTDEIDPSFSPSEKEIRIIRILFDFKKTVQESASEYNPSLIANYVYELAKEYNQFYHDFPVLKAERDDTVIFRLLLSQKTGEIIRFSLKLLGIETPSRM